MSYFKKIIRFLNLSDLIFFCILPILKFVGLFKNSKSLNYNKSFIDLNRKLNIVFFWKQNDSGIYGRRQDMMVKYLMNSGRVDKIIHFDAPIHVDSIIEMMKSNGTSSQNQNVMVAQNCIERFLKKQDDNNIYKRTFVYGIGAFQGRKIFKNKKAYPEFIENCLREVGISDNIVAWVCPVVWDFTSIQRKLKFQYTVADVIDDQTTFGKNRFHNYKVKENYSEVVNSSDLCIVNCERVKEKIKNYTKDVFVIPNGTENFDTSSVADMPDEIKNLRKPIIGYVGDLSIRIDFNLIEKIALEKPDYSIVLIGSMNENCEGERLKKYENITFLGVIPYNNVRNYIAYFDVAIIPHLNNTMTQSMDPLKFYLFLSIGIPIVTTLKSRFKEFTSENVLVADDYEDFIMKIDTILKSGKSRKINTDLINSISWDSRIDDVFKAIELSVK